jgi:hypothetical protein
MFIRSPHHLGRGALVGGLALLVAVAVALPASAAEAPVGLGTLASYGVLGASAVTNTGSSVVTGNVGVSPGSAVTGFPPGVVVGGTIHATDADAAAAQAAATTAYDDAAGRATTAAVGADIGGQTFGPGVYTASSTLGVTGTASLDAKGDPSAVFVFQVGSALTTASASSIALLNGAQACNVFWKVTSSATLGTASTFVGTLVALADVTATTGAAIDGRLVARTGAVTLDNNRITAPVCAASSTATTTAVATPTTAPADAATTDAGTPAAVPPGTNTPSPPGTTTGGAARVPTLPRTGVSPTLWVGAMLLIAFGLALSWVGRPLLAHGRRR